MLCFDNDYEDDVCDLQASVTLMGLMSTILSWLEYTFIPIETLFSKWEYQKPVLGKPLGYKHLRLLHYVQLE